MPFENSWWVYTDSPSLIYSSLGVSTSTGVTSTGASAEGSAMSPQTMIQLAKMGVNRPNTEDDYTRQFGENANGTYQSLLDAYKLALANGWIK